MSKVIADLSRVTAVGLDLTKHVFQVHCIDGEGRVVLNRSLRRREVEAFFASLPGCLVGMEACGSAHHWGRALIALGHDVKLMLPTYSLPTRRRGVKPYVRRQKNDAVDAAARQFTKCTNLVTSMMSKSTRMERHRRADALHLAREAYR